MLTIWGRARTFCDAVTRRDVLRIAALGGVLSLADLLRLQASSGTVARKRSVIFIYLPGGPSHIDTYDPKPQAPVEYRGQFKAIPTRLTGVYLCEHMPLQAARMDKLAVIRSVVGGVDEHSDSQVMTGYSEAQNRTAQRPSLGSVVARLRSDSEGVPPFVSLRGLMRGLEPGYLGAAYRAFTPSGPGMRNLSLARGITLERLQDRRSLLNAFDRLRRDLEVSGVLDGMDAYVSQAFDIITSGTMRRALDVSREDPRVRDRYGRATQFLLARRLIEAGVGCVTLAFGGWDTHSNNFRTLEQQLPQLDHAVATLLDDLHQRGLAQDTLLVMWGEFGRTPRVNGSAGRDHWPRVMSCLIAGGVRTGQVIGATNSRGEFAQSRPCTIQNVLATVYRFLGIDPAMTFTDHRGRPVHLLDDPQPIAELL
ncbi:MAG: DUF1501 domain-containing protein [Gemmataceae bacterium]